MEIKVGEDAAHVETVNVSASGVYFTSPTFIEPLTKLRIVLDIPGEGGKSRGLVCDGVVVRTEPEANEATVSEYQVACYFTDVSDAERLEKYILSHVPF
jgi:hypothetical protein